MVKDFHTDSLDKALEDIFWLFQEATEHNNRGFRLPAFSTVGKDGKPNVRRMILRHFLPKSRECVIYTDLRSEKISHIQSNSWAELCFWDKKRSVQVRCLCEVSLIDYLSFHKIIGGPPDIGDGKDYSTTLSPGQDINDYNYNSDSDPKNNFGALVCKITELEWLYLGERNVRARYVWNKGSKTPEYQSFIVP